MTLYKVPRTATWARNACRLEQASLPVDVSKEAKRLIPSSGPLWLNLQRIVADSWRTEYNPGIVQVIFQSKFFLLDLYLSVSSLSNDSLCWKMAGTSIIEYTIPGKGNCVYLGADGLQASDCFTNGLGFVCSAGL